MFLRKIALRGFRSYEAAEFGDFSPGVNVFAGPNAAGKTNLLEAVYYLSRGVSFRTRSDREALRAGSPFAGLRGEAAIAGHSYIIDVTFSAEPRSKNVSVNDVKQKNLLELPLYAVLFVPEDLNLARGGAVLRRRWMDTAITLLRPKYGGVLAGFRQVFDAKSAILKDNAPDRELLSVYNEQIARYSAELAWYRALWLEKLAPIAAEFHQKLSGGAETLGLVYSPSCGEILGRAEMFELYQASLQSHESAELASTRCLVGAHKDDIELRINGAPDTYWSQGQTRTAALSLKFAEREFICRDVGRYPLLLLDDVLSELDTGRKGFVMEKLSEGQTFLTTCEEPENIGNSAMFHVKQFT
ncbi:MAG: DNA replication/repair protein RecF [Oscillospiraceae bacterium]|jgi:DNA replication and repair protein RecF|nr:DNA replication/repair protein RecF [Oscillospiraceae bacterium]